MCPWQGCKVSSSSVFLFWLTTFAVFTNYNLPINVSKSEVSLSRNRVWREFSVCIVVYSKLLKIYVPTVIYGVNEEEEIVEILDSGYWNIFHNTQAHRGCSQVRSIFGRTIFTISQLSGQQKKTKDWGGCLVGHWIEYLESGCSSHKQPSPIGFFMI